MYKIHSWVMLLSPLQASFCREAGEKEKGSAQGTMGRGREKRGLLPPFPLSVFPIVICGPLQSFVLINVCTTCKLVPHCEA